MKKHLLFITILSFIFSPFQGVVFAAAPSGGYDPGETLDPDCAPGDSDCIVASLIAQDEGVDLSGNVLKLNFTGDGVSSSISSGVVTVNVPGGASSPWTTSGSDIYYNDGNVGIGTDTPDPGFNLTVSGNAKFENSGEVSSLIVGGGLLGTEAGIYGVNDNEIATYDEASGYYNYAGGVLSYGGSTLYVNGNFGPFNVFTDNGTVDPLLSFSGNSNSGINWMLGLEEVNGSGNFYITQSDYDGSALYVDTSTNNIVIGGGSSDSSSILQINSTEKGFLTPRMTTTQRNAISSPAEGLLVFDTSVGVFYYFDGTTWKDMSSVIKQNNTNTLYSTNAGTQVGLNSVILGLNAGLNVDPSLEYSNFIGENAGSGATYAIRSNFIGLGAGINAENAGASNFIGEEAGGGATNSDNSNFIGTGTGSDAVNADNSNFIGTGAGAGATNAASSIFIGSNTGAGAINAVASIFIGNSAGSEDVVDNTVSGSSILIGEFTSTGGFSNSIALGASAVNTASNQFMIGSTTSPIDTTRINGSGSTQCTITTGTGIACTSDERLKDNITNLVNGTLEKLRDVRTVTYTWLNNPSAPEQVGFIAQNLEGLFPQLVATDNEGYKSVFYSQMTPILTKAIQELSDVVYGIFDELTTRKIQTEELCVGATCITEEQFLEVFGNMQQGSGNQTPQQNTPEPTPEEVVGEPENSQEENTEVTEPEQVVEETPEQETEPTPEEQTQTENTDI